MRGVRSQLTELISGLAVQDLAPMSLGLFQSLSRYKLKFSPDKVKSLNIWPLKFCICTQNLFVKACFVFGKDETWYALSVIMALVAELRGLLGIWEV